MTSVATSMPAPAQRMPLRAVTGELMRFSPTMNSTAVDEVARLDRESAETAVRHQCVLLRPGARLPLDLNISSMRSVTT